MDQSRLYYQAPYVKSFMSTVTGCAPSGRETWLVTLNQTGFYPEGGGQPWDTGTLNGARVVAVHEKNGEVIHEVESPFEEGTFAEGVIDWQRRFDHMQNHTGEHILSGLVHAAYGYDNVGFHMSADEVTVDFNGPLTMDQILEIEARANQLVWENVPVEESFFEGEELAHQEYRSKKELAGPVRLITIPGGDVCACCGTHVARTGEIGLIKVTWMINYKGGVRLGMVCGRWALENYKNRVIRDTRIGNLLSAKQDEIDGAVERMLTESQGKDQQIGALWRRLFEQKTAAFPEKDEPLCLFEEEASPVRLRQYCTMLWEGKKGSVVLVCSGEEGNYSYALGSETHDCRAIAKALNSALNGRGGGSVQMAQGTFRADEASVRRAFLQVTGEV